MPNNPFDFDATESDQPAPSEPPLMEGAPTPVEPAYCDWAPRGPQLPEPGFLMAIAHGCLLLTAQVIVLVPVVAIAFVVRGHPDFNVVAGPMFALLTSTTAVYALIAVRFTYGPSMLRAVALRRCNVFQGLLIPITVLPVFVLCSATASAVQGLQDAALKAAGLGPALESALPAILAGDPFEQMFEALGGLSWPMLLAFGCLMPAAGEELFFRGFLGRGLVGRYGLYVGVGLTSLGFAFIHGYPPQAASALLLGMTVHLLYLSTKSLLVPMLYHFLHNLLAFSIDKFAGAGLIEVTTSDGIMTLPWWLVLGALLAVPALGWLWYQTRTRWLLPDGGVWTPGYLSAEMPPRQLLCVPRSNWPGIVAVLAAAGAYILFAALLALVMVGWVSKAGPMRHFRKGDEYRDRHQWDEAIAAYTAGLQGDPKHGSAYSNRGLCHANKKDYELARKDLDEAVRLDPELGDAFNIRGWVHVELRDYAAAIKDLDRAIELGIKRADTWVNRGIAHGELGQHREAIHDFKEAIALDSKDALPRMRVAWLLATSPNASLRDGKAAVEHGQKACDLTDAKDPWALNALAAAHAENKNFREAIRHAEKAVILSSQADRAWYEHCLQLYRERKPYRTEVKGD